MNLLAPDFLAALTAAAGGIGLTPAEVATLAGPLGDTLAMRSVRGHRSGGLLLLGKTGSGKTLAAARWLVSPLLNPSNWNFDGNRWWYAFHAPRLFRTARSLTQVKQYEGNSVEPLLAARALVLDDLGQEYLDKGGFLASLIDHVVTERHRRALPTVITANLSADEFAERYGDRSISRIGGTGGVVLCDGADLRLAPPDKRPLVGVPPAAVEARRLECEAATLAHLSRPAVVAAAAPPVKPPEATKLTAEEEQARKDEINRVHADRVAQGLASA